MSPYDLTIDLLRGDQHIGQHIFRFEPGEREWEVRQVTRSFEHPDASSTCILTVRPERYVSVDLLMRRGERRISLQVSAGEDGDLLLRSGGGDPVRITAAAGERLLFDGPGPIFDCINAILVLGICDGECLDLPVHLLDPEEGRCSRRLYRFARRGSVITIARGIDPLGDSMIVLDEDGIGVMAYHAAGYSYHFNQEKG